MSNFRIINLHCGLLKGEEVISKLGKKYVSFKGIPYAKPPVGNLRFKPPQPLSNWNGVRDALKEGNRAPHFDIVTKEFCGSEDCLYLNVYTPEVPEPDKKPFKLKPVMFWIHGGGFAFGHGDSDVYGPELLVHHDVILVTSNYRLGVLGFLNLELEEASGNMGMKDQVAALRWVKNEIEAFGGDPNNVTIFGNSAGGASVHLHMMSDMSKGLFHKAIAQSGNALCSWSFSIKNKDRAFALGKLLGFETQDEKQLLNFFYSVPPVQFAKHQDDVMGIMDHLKEVDQAFVPSVEKVFLNNEPFIAAHPKTLLKSGKFNNDIPFLVGVNSHEGLAAIFAAKKYPQFIEEADSKFHTLLPISEVTDEKVKKIRDFYFHNIKMSDNPERLVQFYSDIVYLLPTYEVITIHLKHHHKKIYFYRFSFDGKFGWYKRLMAKHRDVDLEDVPAGAHHCDELGYLFSNNVLNLQDLTKPSTELKVTQILPRIWTNFAKTGEPSLPDPSLKWAPVSEENLNVLDISESLMICGNSVEKRINCWKDFNISTSQDN